MEQGNGAPTWPGKDTSTKPPRTRLTSAAGTKERTVQRIGQRLTRAPVSWHGESAARSALRLAVAFEDETAQGGSEEGQHSGGDGC